MSIQPWIAESNHLEMDMDSILADQLEGKEWKCRYETSGQLKRPNVFLQCLLDVLRIVFEPHPPGTIFLNAKPMTKPLRLTIPGANR